MNNIRDLKSLRERQELLKLEMQITEKAIRTSLKSTQHETRSYLIKQVLIPLGAGSLVTLILNKEMATEDKPGWLVFAEQAVEKANEFFSRVNPMEQDSE